MIAMKAVPQAWFMRIAFLLWVVSLSAVTAQETVTDELVTRPVVSEDVSPLMPIEPVASDGYRGEGYMRRPPGDGPFPAVVFVHGGLTRWPTDDLLNYSHRAHPSRFLAAGFVVAVVTYRSRDDDPQSDVSRKDVVAAIDQLKALPYVDSASLVVRGTSGGGDLALAVAATTDVAAIIAEEPASIMFTGIWNEESPKAGDRYTPRDGNEIFENPSAYYTDEWKRHTQAKIASINAPILIVQGHPSRNINSFNAAVLLPELAAAGKTFDVHEYAEEPHSFAFYSQPGRTPRPSVALKAYEAMVEWLMPHLATKPVPIEPSLVQYSQWP